jgi:hypothetical protein
MTSTDIAVIPTGEVVDLNDARACAIALDEIREIERQLREAKSLLTSAVALECQRQGTKTLHLDGGVTVELSGGTRVEYDIAALEKLRDLGLPEDRFTALVVPTVTYKVNAAEAKRIAGANSEYAQVINGARRVVDMPTRATVKR